MDQKTSLRLQVRATIHSHHCWRSTHEISRLHCPLFRLAVRVWYRQGETRAKFCPTPKQKDDYDERREASGNQFFCKHLFKCLLQIRFNVINVLNSRADPDLVWPYARSYLFLLTQLLVGGRC